MLETAVALICAHLLADFVTQTDWMVEHKKRPWVLGLHIAFVVAWAALLLGSVDIPLLLVLLISHLAMDAAKTWWLDRGPKPKLSMFILDQVVHLLTIAGLVLWRPGEAAAGLWGGLPAQTQDDLWAAMACVSGLILAVMTGGLVIKMMTAPLVPATELKGLAKGGRYIGWLERSLTFLFVMYGHPEGVGFLITAKSIFRFGDITDTTKREQTEYIIIGTMVSFGWGLVVAIATAAAVRHWLA
jgi:uncharacterized membrane protein YhdT